MANVTIAGATYNDVPAIQVPSGSGTASFYETKEITYNLTGGASASVTPSEVVAGQGFSLKLKAPAGYNLNGVTITMGGVDITSQVFTPDEAGGGGVGSVTVTEEANATGITCVITTSSEPTPPEPTPSDIPLNTELVDYTAVKSGYSLADNTGAITAGESWDAISDYIPIDPSMTFTFKTLKWYNVGFYNSSKNVVRVVSGSDIETSSSNDVSTGTLNASNIPSTAAYIILSGNSYSLQTTMSLIRTA